MRRILILAAFLFAALVEISAQAKNHKLSGSVKDQAGTALAAITVSLLKKADSSLVKVSVTGKDGNYEFENIPDGVYRLLLTSTGFEKVYSDSFQLDESKPELQLPPISLTPASKGLSEVTVTAKRPFIETKIDKTVVNVDASPTNAGATALEVLEKSPGIMVSNDGVISLRGKAGVIVMMDGKQTFLSPTDLANLLKNMPASAIDQIEIMTNPSAKFDAAGNSGVINIKTKKGQAGGFNGSIMAGITGSYYRQDGKTYIMARSQNSINFNYRKNKFNFFGNYNPNASNGRSFLQINRTKLDQGKNILGYNDLETRFRFGNNNHTLKLGLDYFADKKNTFGFVVSGFTFSGHPTPKTVTTTRDQNMNVESVMSSYTENRLKFQNLTSNFNFRHVFDTAGKELTADLDFIVYDNTSNQTLTTDFFDGLGQSAGDPLILKGHLPANIKIYSAKSDYVHPLKKGGKIEAGIKASYVKNNNLVDYQRWDGAKWVKDNRSNQFIYDENINAAYSKWQQTNKKLVLPGRTAAGKYRFQRIPDHQ